MEVTFDFRPQDYWHFNKYVNFHVLFPLRKTVIVLFVIACVTAVLADVGGANPIDWLVSFVIFFVIFSLVGYCVAKLLVMRLPSGRPGFLGQHTVNIGPEGMHDRTPVGDDFRSWPGVMNIVSDKHYIHILVDRMAGISIPIRAFPSESKMQQFFETAMSYWKNATIPAGN